MNHLSSQVQTLICVCQCFCFVSLSQRKELKWIHLSSIGLNITGKCALHRQQDGRWHLCLSLILQYIPVQLLICSRFICMMAYFSNQNQYSLAQSIYYAVYDEYSQPLQGQWEFPIIFFFFFPLSALVETGTSTVCPDAYNTSTLKWLEKYGFYVNLCPLLFIVPVFEEHQNIPQGVPWQVWPSPQRTVRPLWPVWCQGLRQGEFNLFMLCFYPELSPACEPALHFRYKFISRFCFNN